MLIRTFAQQTGVPVKTIRFYESRGVLPSPQRAANNYRQYTPADVHRLRWIASARRLGFHLDEIAALLTADEADATACPRVLTALEHRAAELDRHIEDLLTLRQILERLRGAAPERCARNDG